MAKFSRRVDPGEIVGHTVGVGALVICCGTVWVATEGVIVS